MPLVTTTFNHKSLLRIAIVMAFIQFTNALEYMMFNPVFAFMAADFAVPVSFAGYVSGMYTFGAVLLLDWPFQQETFLNRQHGTTLPTDTFDDIYLQF